MLVCLVDSRSVDLKGGSPKPFRSSTYMPVSVIQLEAPSFGDTQQHHSLWPQDVQLYNQWPEVLMTAPTSRHEN